MTNFTLQDPRTFDTFEPETIRETCLQFFLEDKMAFLVNYFVLTNTEKFYALYTTLFVFDDVQIMRKLYLEELREDLQNLKLMNRPRGEWLFFDGYTGYLTTPECSSTISDNFKLCDALSNDIKKIAA